MADKDQRGKLDLSKYSAFNKKLIELWGVAEDQRKETNGTEREWSESPDKEKITFETLRKVN